jgi:hypothetical protein
MNEIIYFLNHFLFIINIYLSLFSHIKFSNINLKDEIIAKALHSND